MEMTLHEALILVKDLAIHTHRDAVKIAAEENIPLATSQLLVENGTAIQMVDQLIKDLPVFGVVL